MKGVTEPLVLLGALLARREQMIHGPAPVWLTVLASRAVSVFNLARVPAPEPRNRLADKEMRQIR